MDRASLVLDVDASTRPKPRDLGLCIRCGALMQYD